MEPTPPGRGAARERHDVRIHSRGAGHTVGAQDPLVGGVHVVGEVAETAALLNGAGESQKSLRRLSLVRSSTARQHVLPGTSQRPGVPVAEGEARGPKLASHLFMCRH